MDIGNKYKSQDIELLLHNISNTIERLKTEYNLFFAGEIRVPPEREREQLEKKVRNLVSGGSKNPRIALLIQNVSSKFTLYNNMWLKRLNELEGGFVRNRRKPISFDEPIKKKTQKKTQKKTTVDVSLNNEDSFEEFYDNYKKMSKQQSAKIMDKDKMINSIKTKLITANLIDVKIDLQIEKGKVKLKLKKQKFE